MSTTALYRKPFLQWGVATRAVPGETVSGDLHLVEPFACGALVAVVDGLGHGDEATVAARKAIDILKANAAQSVIALTRRCHEALRKTRGAVMTLASFNRLDGTVSWLSVGNVTGLLLRADAGATPRGESALLRGGVVGYQLPALLASDLAVSPNDLLVLASDGIRGGFEQSIIATDTPQRIADRILSRQFRGTDDALALVVRFLGTCDE